MQTTLPGGPQKRVLDPRWDATDPNVLDFASGPRLMRLDVRSKEPTVLHESRASFFLSLRRSIAASGFDGDPINHVLYAGR